jgi:hypothetical protein
MKGEIAKKIMQTGITLKCLENIVRRVKGYKSLTPMLVAELSRKKQ